MWNGVRGAALGFGPKKVWRMVGSDGQLRRPPIAGHLPVVVISSVAPERRGASPSVRRCLAEPGREKLRQNPCVAAFAERTVSSLPYSSTKSWMAYTAVRGRRKLFSYAAAIRTCAT